MVVLDQKLNCLRMYPLRIDFAASLGLHASRREKAACLQATPIELKNGRESSGRNYLVRNLTVLVGDWLYSFLITWKRDRPERLSTLRLARGPCTHFASHHSIHALPLNPLLETSDKPSI